MGIQSITPYSDKLLQSARDLVTNAKELDIIVKNMAKQGGADMMSPFMIGLSIFVLACVVGYYVVWRVTPALHSPLMAVTNAVSSVIIVGAIIATGQGVLNMSSILGFLAVVLASVNIFGGFIVTQRMLGMFNKKK